MSVGACSRAQHPRDGHFGSPSEGGRPPRNVVDSALSEWPGRTGGRRWIGVGVGELRGAGRRFGPETGVDAPGVLAERRERLRPVAVVPVEDAAGEVDSLAASRVEVRGEGRVVDVVEHPPAAVPQAVLGLVLRRERDPPGRVAGRLEQRSSRPSSRPPGRSRPTPGRPSRCRPASRSQPVPRRPRRAPRRGVRSDRSGAFATCVPCRSASSSWAWAAHAGGGSLDTWRHRCSARSRAPGTWRPLLLQHGNARLAHQRLRIDGAGRSVLAQNVDRERDQLAAAVDPPPQVVPLAARPIEERAEVVDAHSGELRRTGIGWRDERRLARADAVDADLAVALPDRVLDRDRIRDRVPDRKADVPPEQVEPPRPLTLAAPVGKRLEELPRTSRVRSRP